jgi:phosphoribosylformimino-5-aminoimidazole carboxamide ribotide isomerase
VVVGTAAALDPGFIPAALTAVGPARLAVGIDVRAGFIALRGWSETSARRGDDLAREVVGQGIETLVHTDIGRDGMMGGPDISGAGALQALGARVFASGGVAHADDIRAACAAGLDGMIVGRALYEGGLSLVEGLEAARCTSAR